MTFNFPTAYLVRNNSGIFTLKQSGEPEERINNVHITIDNQNNLFASYEIQHWRMSVQFLWDIEHGLNTNPEKVLPEYRTKITITERNFWGRKKEVEKEVVMDGLVRLNKPVVHRVVRTNNWYIETNDQQIISRPQNVIL